MYQQLAQLIRDGVWLKSYLAAVMRLQQEAYLVGLPPLMHPASFPPCPLPRLAHSIPYDDCHGCHAAGCALCADDCRAH